MMTEDVGSSSYDKGSATMNTNYSTEYCGSIGDLKRKIKDEPVDQDAPCKLTRYDSPSSGGANPGSVLPNKVGNSGRSFTKDTAGAVSNDGLHTVQSGYTTIKAAVASGDTPSRNNQSCGITCNAGASGNMNTSSISLPLGNIQTRMTVSDAIAARDGVKPVAWNNKLLNGISVLSVSNGLTTAQKISSAPLKEPAKVSATPTVIGQKRPSTLHRCRLCSKIFASAAFLSKHVAQKHSDELKKRTLKVMQDVDKTVNKTSEHQLARSEHLPGNTKHHPGITEHHPRINEHTPRITEHHPRITEHTPGITELRPKILEHQSESTKHQFGNAELFEDALNVIVVKPKSESQDSEETKMISEEQTSVVEDEEVQKKEEEQQLKEDEDHWQKNKERWKTVEEQTRINKVRSLKEGELIKKGKEDEEKDSE